MSKSRPLGIVSVTSPVAVVITTSVLPFSCGVIEAICPAALVVKALLLLFSPVG